MQTQKVQGVRTDIFTDEHGTHVSYRGTKVVSFNADTIILRSGGWQTNTTKLRMNQASNQYRLGYQVYQVNFDWIVRYKGQDRPFVDGMTINRKDK